MLVISELIRRWLFQLLKLGHGYVVAEMSLKELVGDESLGRVSLRVDERDVVVDLADPLQLIRVAMVMWASIDTNEENSNVYPRKTQQVELKLVHICCLAIEKQQ